MKNLLFMIMVALCCFAIINVNAAPVDVMTVNANQTCVTSTDNSNLNNLNLHADGSNEAYWEADQGGLCALDWTTNTTLNNNFTGNFDQESTLCSSNGYMLIINLQDNDAELVNAGYFNKQTCIVTT